MAVQEERGYHHGDLRSALIEAAWQQLTRGGVAALSLRKAAAAVGVSHSAPRRHFADHQALVAAMAEEGFQRLGDALRVALAKPPESSPLQRLHASGQAYVRFAVEHPAHYRLMFGGIVSDPERHPTFLKAIETTAGVMRQAVEQCQTAGVLRRGRTAAVELTMRAAMHGLASLAIDGALGQTMSEPAALHPLVEAVMTTIDRGIAAHD